MLLNQEGVIISDLGESPGGNYAATARAGASYHIFPIFCLNRARSKIHTWKLFIKEKIFGHGKIKRGRKSSAKKRKQKTGSQKKESLPICHKATLTLDADI